MKRILFVVALTLLSINIVSIAADFNGDGTGDITIFRDSSGLWAIRDITRFYFGTTGDLPKPSDWEGNGTDIPAIFRANSGLWALRGLSRIYFGSSSDKPKPGDYNGDGTEDIGIFRASSGLWAARGITRVYFGSSGDRALAPDAAQGSLRSGGLLKTGQTTETYPGDDGTYTAGISFSYHTEVINGDLITIDNNTGLMWASNGDEAGCFNGQSATWYDSINYCNTLDFASHLDWRLPNKRELESLINSGEAGPAINTTYFPNTQSHSYWSSTSYIYNSTYSWTVDFLLGNTWFSSNTSNRYLRAVRGGL